MSSPKTAVASHVASRETAKDAITVVDKAIAAHGVPQRLLSDNGLALNPSRRGYVGQLVGHVAALGVEAITGKPYKPTTQGKNELFHQTLFRYLDKQPIAESLAELQAQVGTYQRLARCWALAVTGDNPAEAAVEAERIIAANLVDPPRSCVATWYALLGEMLLAAGSTDEASAALDRADFYLNTYGQRYPEGLLLLLRARLLQACGEPAAVVRAVRRKRPRAVRRT